MLLRQLGLRFVLLLTAILALFGQPVASTGATPTFGQDDSGATSLTGFVYYDLNGNGQWDPGEPRAPNALISWEVEEPGAKGLTLTADANGNYSIDLSMTPTDPSHPYHVGAQGVNAAGQVLGLPDVVAEGSITIFVPPGQTATANIGLRMTGEPHPGCVVCDYFPQTQGEVSFGSYFDHRGGVATFGYPISRLFLFQGFPTQIFQRAVLQQWPDGSIHLLNLLDPGFLPFTSFNGAVVPAFDPSLVARAPAPGSPGYSDHVLAFVNANVPDTFAGQLVDFRSTFQNTVTAAAAFPPIPPPSYCAQHGLPPSSCVTPPGYGDPALLTGFDLEIWGVPTSHPMLDPANSSFVYQRFQRGIMHYQASLGVTEGLLLGQYFKAVLTGQGLPSDLAAEAAGSPYLDQYCPTGPHWICRPTALDPTANDLTGAFEPEPPAP
jgi:hypothetical protein